MDDGYRSGAGSSVGRHPPTKTSMVFTPPPSTEALRDHFASIVLKEAAPHLLEVIGRDALSNAIEDTALLAYGVADAMLKARARP